MYAVGSDTYAFVVAADLEDNFGRWDQKKMYESHSLVLDCITPENFDAPAYVFVVDTNFEEMIHPGSPGFKTDRSFTVFAAKIIFYYHSSFIMNSSWTHHGFIIGSSHSS